MTDKKAGDTPRRGRPVLAIMLAATLGACANGISIDDEWVQAYSGARRPSMEVATIVRGGGFPPAYPAIIDGVNYADFRGVKLRGVEILPGEHTVTLQCEKVNWERRSLIASPSAHGVFLAGRIYEVNCIDSGKSAAASISEVFTLTEQLAPRKSPGGT